MFSSHAIARAFAASSERAVDDRLRRQSPPIARLLFVSGTPCALTAAAAAGELFCDGWVTPGDRGLQGMRYTAEEVPRPTGPTWIPL